MLLVLLGPWEEQGLGTPGAESGPGRNKAKGPLGPFLSHLLQIPGPSSDDFGPETGPIFPKSPRSPRQAQETRDSQQHTCCPPNKFMGIRSFSFFCWFECCKGPADANPHSLEETSSRLNSAIMAILEARHELMMIRILRFCLLTLEITAKWRRSTSLWGFAAGSRLAMAAS